MTLLLRLLGTLLLLLAGMGGGFAAAARAGGGRRRLRSKDIPHIFRGLPSVLIYIGILSLAIYGLVGTVD